LIEVELEELSMKIRKSPTGLLIAGMFAGMIAGTLVLPVASRADTQSTHRVHKVKKQQPPPPPLPSGTRGPVPQVPLDSLPAVAPQVSYQDGLLTIVAPNSTLSEILRSVRKHTAAEIEIPSAAGERVATHLGPGPAREVMAELLNGSRFNYILLGSPTDSNQLVRVVLVAKTPETPNPANGENAPPGAAAPNADAPEAEAASEDTPDDNGDQATADEPAPAEQPGVKTPQQMLQEMQQRQLLQQQQAGQNPQYPAPNGMPMPMRPPQPQPQQQEQQ
jgi:hypothetical protein